MSDDSKNIRIVYISVFIIYLVSMILTFYTQPLKEAAAIFVTIPFQLLLLVVTFNYYITTRDTLHNEKKESDIKLKQKQLELFYNPLLLSITKCQNSPVRAKNGIDQLFKYQYLILDSNIKQYFQNYADINHKETPNELEDFKCKVKTEIDRIESELVNLYKK